MTAQIFFLGQAIGSLDAQAHANGVTVSARCPFEAGFFYRLELVSGEERLPLGVMLPRGSSFVTEKLLGQKYIPFFEGEVRGEVFKTPMDGRRDTALPFEFSELCADNGEIVFSDPEIRALSLFSGAMWVKKGEMKYLVFKLEPGEKSDFSSVFCITRPIWREGVLYGMLAEDGEGRAVCPPG